MLTFGAVVRQNFAFFIFRVNLFVNYLVIAFVLILVESPGFVIAFNFLTQLDSTGLFSVLCLPSFPSFS